MLNCTDLECILHHHHYYQHLHQLAGHGTRDALSTAAEDLGEELSQSENETNAFQSLSYLDTPVDNIYMIFGVLISMVLVGVIIILLAVTISKLRKREDAHHHHHHPQNTVHPEQVQVQCAPPCANNNNTTTGSTIAPPLPTVQVISNNNNNDDCTDGGVINPAMSTSTSSVDSCCNVVSSNKANETLVYATATSAEQFIWQFPPPYPPPNTPPPQYTLYNDQDTLVHGLSQQDRQGFAKGFRKNLGGRWRRLVKRKPESEMCAIPPELKDQLKTIYVY